MKVAGSPGQIDRTLVSLTAPESFAAEQYQGLRLKIERLQQTRGIRVIAITSPGVSEGKSVTSINLAAALAQGSGARVLLIDADLRRPAVGAHLGLDDLDGAGLADAIGDERIGLAQVVRRLDHANRVAVVLPGSRSTTVHELFRSARFASLLQEAREHYDYVVLDTPPLVPVCDAALLSRLVDGTLVVVAAHETPRKLLEEALNMLDESKVLGIVFNGDNESLAGHYEAYSYSRQ
jgi:capsular exopolysaccharide synthesis family protein